MNASHGSHRRCKNKIETDSQQPADCRRLVIKFNFILASSVPTPHQSRACTCSCSNVNSSRNSSSSCRDHSNINLNSSNLQLSPTELHMRICLSMPCGSFWQYRHHAQSEHTENQTRQRGTTAGEFYSPTCSNRQWCPFHYQTVVSSKNWSHMPRTL